MTRYRKSLILNSAPPPKSTQKARTQAFKLKYCLMCFISIDAVPVCKISTKILTIALVIVKFDLLTPPPGSRVCLWAKNLLPCCCQRRQLKFDMQHDHILKKFNFDLGPTPLVHPTGSDPGLQTEIPFDVFHIY